MKIAITGSAGIGKTTLANALSKRFGVPLLLEDMQPVVKALAIFQAANQQTLGQAQRGYVQACEKWLQNREKAQSQGKFVADRCAIDILSRWMTSGVLRDDNQLFLNLVTICKRQTEGLDLIVVPPLLVFDTAPKQNEDGLSRQGSYALKLQSHSLARGLLEQLINTPKLYLPPEATELESRVDLVTQTLKHLGKL